MPSTGPKIRQDSTHVPEQTRTMIFGEVIRVLGPRRVEVEVVGQTRVEARCAQHISTSWLEAALALVGPVPVGLVQVSPDAAPFIQAIFDGPEFDEVLADVEISSRNLTLRAQGQLEVSATESVQVRVDRSTLKLTRDEVELRGKDVISRARRTNRIKGGTIRQN